MLKIRTHLLILPQGFSCHSISDPIVKADGQGLQCILKITDNFKLPETDSEGSGLICLCEPHVMFYS